MLNRTAKSHSHIRSPRPRRLNGRFDFLFNWKMGRPAIYPQMGEIFRDERKQNRNYRGAFQKTCRENPDVRKNTAIGRNNPNSRRPQQNAIFQIHVD